MPMLFVVAWALQAAAATPPLTVRTGERTLQVATVVGAGGGTAVRADQLVAALGGIFSDEGERSVEVQLDGLHIELLEDASFVVVGRDTAAMSATIFRRDGKLYLPYVFVSQLLPRLTNTMRYDAKRRELRHVVGATATAAAATAAAARGPDTIRPAPRAGTAQATRGVSAIGLRSRLVVVDAGHGGPDNGMSGPIGVATKVREKDITLAVAKALRVALEKRGITVVMTRTRDTLIALADRGRIANQAKGDLFVSVHVNAANPGWRDPGGARGYETYFLAEAKTEDEKRVEAMENEAIRFETSADSRADDPLGFIIRDMAQNEHLRESSQLADLMQRALRKVHPGTDRGVKQAGFKVLVTAFMPAVLVEVGFGSNREDARYMTDPARQRELAESLANAMVSYLQQYDRKVGGTP